MQQRSSDRSPLACRVCRTDHQGAASQSGRLLGRELQRDQFSAPPNRAGTTLRSLPARRRRWLPCCHLWGALFSAAGTAHHISTEEPGSQSASQLTRQPASPQETHPDQEPASLASQPACAWEGSCAWATQRARKTLCLPLPRHQRNTMMEA